LRGAQQTRRQHLLQAVELGGGGAGGVGAIRRQALPMPPVIWRHDTHAFQRKRHSPPAPDGL
jgi:hypothetical protein